MGDGPMDLELSALLDEDLCLLFEFGFIDRVLLFRALQHRAWRKLKCSVSLRQYCLSLIAGIGAGPHLDLFFNHRLRLGLELLRLGYRF